LEAAFPYRGRATVWTLYPSSSDKWRDHVTKCDWCERCQPPWGHNKHFVSIFTFLWPVVRLKKFIGNVLCVDVPWHKGNCSNRRVFSHR
jgi:hypothetical protein